MARRCVCVALSYAIKILLGGLVIEWITVVQSDLENLFMKKEDLKVRFFFRKSQLPMLFSSPFLPFCLFAGKVTIVCALS